MPFQVAFGAVCGGPRPAQNPSTQCTFYSSPGCSAEDGLQGAGWEHKHEAPPHGELTADQLCLLRLRTQSLLQQAWSQLPPLPTPTILLVPGCHGNHMG